MRKDLLALGEADLVALANRGLYKRAVKELAKEKFVLSTDDQGTVTLTTDDVTTRLAIGERLAQAQCSCAATGFCRHKVLAVLAYQQTQETTKEPQDWCPSCFDDQTLEQSAGKKRWKRVRRTLQKEMRIKLTRGPKPAASLPTCHVSFLVPDDLNYARCDCAERGFCDHIVLAALAFRESGDRVTLGQKQAKKSFDLLKPEQHVITLLEQGLASTTQDVGEAMAVTEAELRKNNLLWLADLQKDLAESLDHYHRRSAEFHSALHGQLLLEWWVRSKASEHGSPSVLLGLGQSPETELEHTSFTCLGMQTEQFPDSTKAKLYLADANTGVVTVLKKTWSGSVPSHQLGQRQVAKNVRLKELSCGRLVTEGAIRKANRELRLRTSRLGRHAVFQDTGDWLERFREPLLVTNFERAVQEFKACEPSLFRARVEAENLRILQVATCQDLTYSPGSQELRAHLFDQYGNQALLSFCHQKSEPQALNVLAKSLTRGVKAISGFVTLSAGLLRITPLSVVGPQGVQCLATAGPAPLPADLPYQALDTRLSQPERAWEICCEAAHRGLKFLPQNWRQDCLDVAAECQQAGFAQLGIQLEHLANNPKPETWWRAAVRGWLLRG